MSPTEKKILTPDQLAGLACVVCGVAPKSAIPFDLETPSSSHVFRCTACAADRDQVAQWIAHSLEHVVVVGYPRERLAGSFLQGPREPEKVKRDGYGFTREISEAWAFDSEAKALAKSRIVDRHMGWGEGVTIVETRSEAVANAASEKTS